jgi:23S rRNA A1618 N6-methylase RlmF
VNVGTLKSTFNSYVMNKQQNTKKNNTIDFADEKATKKMGKAAVSLKKINAKMVY